MSRCAGPGVYRWVETHPTFFSLRIAKRFLPLRALVPQCLSACSSKKEIPAAKATGSAFLLNCDEQQLVPIAVATVSAVAATATAAEATTSTATTTAAVSATAAATTAAAAKTT